MEDYIERYIKICTGELTASADLRNYAENFLKERINQICECLKEMQANEIDVDEVSPNLKYDLWRLVKAVLTGTHLTVKEYEK